MLVFFTFWSNTVSQEGIFVGIHGFIPKGKNSAWHRKMYTESMN
jgi:hypothetical protein